MSSGDGSPPVSARPSGAGGTSPRASVSPRNSNSPTELRDVAGSGGSPRVTARRESGAGAQMATPTSASRQSQSPGSHPDSGRVSISGADGTTFDPFGEKDPRFDLDDSKVPFIERGLVSTFFAIVVLSNAVFIGIDTQSRATESTVLTRPIMLAIDGIFWILFFAELILRMVADKCPHFFYRGWNLMDLFLVVASTVDIMYEVVLTGQEGSNMGKLRAIRLLKITRFARVFRLLRVFRFKRVLRAMRGFVLLVMAIVGAVKSLGWVMFMFIITTYMFGIAVTEFIGLANEEEDPFIEEYFGNLMKSMFTLFQVSTLNDWGVIARHVGRTHGDVWYFFFMIYVFCTNTILFNVVLATLIENVFSLTSDVREAQAGEVEAPESWMKTPSSLASEESEEEEQQGDDATAGGAAGSAGGAAAGGGSQVNAADRIAVQTLSEVFDLVSTYVGVEGVNQRKLVTQTSLKEALSRPEVFQKMAQACPAFKDTDNIDKMSEQIWQACPKHLDAAGLNRQELAEACMALSGELSMNHFVMISQALYKMEKHTEHELVHLNKHQRKMNRRFLKLRHRLRKVYHFDGAPRKMVEMVNEMKRKALENQIAAQGSGKNANKSGEDSGEISLSDDSSEDGGGDKW